MNTLHIIALTSEQKDALKRALRDYENSCRTYILNSDSVFVRDSWADEASKIKRLFELISNSQKIEI